MTPLSFFLNSDRVRLRGMLFDSGSSSSVRSGSFLLMTGRLNAVVPKDGSDADRPSGRPPRLPVLGRGGVTSAATALVTAATRPGVHPALSRSRELLSTMLAVDGRMPSPDDDTRFVRPVDTRDDGMATPTGHDGRTYHARRPTAWATDATSLSTRGLLSDATTMRGYRGVLCKCRPRSVLLPICCTSR